MKLRKVLLIEDNHKDELLTRRALESGLQIDEIIVARDGQEAVDLLFGKGRQDPVVPTVVLLDLRLPKIDGHEVLRRIRKDERTRLLPVVILSSSDDEKDIINGYREGANSYVRKPIVNDAFVNAVQSLGLFWLVTNTPPGNLRGSNE
ncbi:MAG: response regulator [Thermodesulfobacteriota bacterium]